MVPDSPTSNPVSRPRLNPFAFPSDTDFRFAILIVAVLSAALFIYQDLYLAVPSSSVYSAITSTSSNYIEAEWVGLCIALLLSVAGVIYWVFPIWKMWRGGLEPFSAENVPPEVITCLSDLCFKAGLTRPPVFLLNPYNAASSGLTFGRLGRYYVMLNIGLVLQFPKDRPAFCAVVLHELGHIRNADVDKTYFTVALGWAFALAALLPWVVALPFRHQSFVDIFNVGWRVLALALLIYLTIFSILRTREFYADVRASVWDGPMGALRRILGATSRSKVPLWQRLRQAHPEPEERRETLENTSRLFRLPFWMIFATGIVAASGIMNVELMLPLLHSGQFLNNEIVTGIIFALLIVGVVGVATLRATFANLLNGKALPDMLRVSLVLTLGLLLGQALSLFNASTDPLTNFGYFTDIGFLFSGQLTRAYSFSQLGALVLWSLLLLILLFLFLRWLVVSAETWLRVAMSIITLRRGYWTGIIISGIMLGILFGQFYSLRIEFPLFTTSDFASLPAPVVAMLALLPDPSIFIVFTCLWAYPLATWFWRKQRLRPFQQGWEYLEPLSQTEAQVRPLASLHRAPLRPGLALLVGLGGGLAFLVLFSIFIGKAPVGSVAQHLGLAVPQFLSTVLQQTGITMSMALIGIATGTAAIVSAWVPRLGAIHGLFTAFVVGCIGAIEMLAYMHMFDLTTAIGIVDACMMAALPVALIVSTLVRWIRHLSQRNASGTAP